MYIQDMVLLYSINKIIIYLLLFLIIYTIIRLKIKSKSCKLKNMWDKLDYKKIKSELIKIKNKIQIKK